MKGKPKSKPTNEELAGDYPTTTRSVKVSLENGEVHQYDMTKRRAFLLLVDKDKGKTTSSTGQGYPSQLARMIRTFLNNNADVMAHMVDQYQEIMKGMGGNDKPNQTN